VCMRACACVHAYVRVRACMCYTYAHEHTHTALHARRGQAAGPQAAGLATVAQSKRASFLWAAPLPGLQELQGPGQAEAAAVRPMHAHSAAAPRCHHQPAGNRQQRGGRRAMSPTSAANSDAGRAGAAATAAAPALTL